MGEVNLAGKRVLVTGAGGFIGGALAERLAGVEGARVRAFVRRSSPGVLPGDVEIAVGDMTDDDARRSAVQGCNLVVHCAALQGARATLAEFRRVNVEATVGLLRAARDAGVERFVHLSTINVHGFPPPANAGADSPLSFKGDFYSISKAEGERALWEVARQERMPMVVVRPACTFGPRSNAWTLQPLMRLRRRRPVLVDGGRGICNAVYIDNLVDLILLAAKRPAALGQAFIGAEGRGVTWREFYGAYAQMSGIRHLSSLPRPAATALAVTAEAFARASGRPPFLSLASLAFYSHRVVYDISKSERLLGYKPRIAFEEGMLRTRRWLEANGILKEAGSKPEMSSHQ